MIYDRWCALTTQSHRTSVRTTARARPAPHDVWKVFRRQQPAASSLRRAEKPAGCLSLAAMALKTLPTHTFAFSSRTATCDRRRRRRRRWRRWLHAHTVFPSKLGSAAAAAAAAARRSSTDDVHFTFASSQHTTHTQQQLGNMFTFKRRSLGKRKHARTHARYLQPTHNLFGPRRCGGGSGTPLPARGENR